MGSGIGCGSAPAGRPCPNSAYETTCRRRLGCGSRSGRRLTQASTGSSWRERGRSRRLGRLASHPRHGDRACRSQPQPDVVSGKDQFRRAAASRSTPDAQPSSSLVAPSRAEHCSAGPGQTGDGRCFGAVGPEVVLGKAIGVPGAPAGRGVVAEPVSAPHALVPISNSWTSSTLPCRSARYQVIGRHRAAGERSLQVVPFAYGLQGVGSAILEGRAA